jgi:hypothetical protein
MEVMYKNRGGRAMAARILFDRGIPGRPEYCYDSRQAGRLRIPADYGEE